ncbi:MAG TPA: hypothetical protein VN698_08760, partial [Bacteroidia bacterium]|nr:hypothetical protein [Bacteroidia bacterium]
KVLKNNNLKSEYSLVYVIIVTFLFTTIIIPCVAGYLDAIGLLYIGFLMILIYEDALSKKDIPNLLLTFFLLIVMSVTRRWYLFWLVAFFPSYFIAGIIRFATDKSYTRKSLITLTINLTIIGVVYIGILYRFFKGFFQRSLFNNYSDVYSAYKWGGYTENFNRTIFYLSIPVILISIIGIYTGIKNKASRLLSLVQLIQLAIILFLFFRIQSFSLQHYYLIAPTILFFLAMGFATIFVIPKWGKYISSVLILLQLLSFTHTFTNWPSIRPNEVQSYLFPVTGFQISDRSDLKRIEALVEYLNSLSNNNRNKSVYILASSHIINDDILRNTNLPYDMNSMKGLCNNNCHVDKVHGFPQDLLGADIVVVADPIQYHLRPEDQRVVGIPAEEILSGRGIGKSYRLLKEFSIMNDIKLKVYEKIKPYSLGAIDSLLATFKSYYPEYPNLYSVNFYPAIIYDKKITDGYSEIVFFNNYHSIYIHPGDSAPTSFKIGLDGQFSKIKLETSFKDPQQIEKSCEGKGGEVFFKVYIDGILKLDNYQTYRDTVNSELPVKGAKELKIEVDKAKNNASCDGFEIDNLELIK